MTKIPTPVFSSNIIIFSITSLTVPYWNLIPHLSHATSSLEIHIVPECVTTTKKRFKFSSSCSFLFFYIQKHHIRSCLLLRCIRMWYSMHAVIASVLKISLLCEILVKIYIFFSLQFFFKRMGKIFQWARFIEPHQSCHMMIDGFIIFKLSNKWDFYEN